MSAWKDHKQGMIKVYWSDIREKVASVEPMFAQLVDEISPGNKEITKKHSQIYSASKSSNSPGSFGFENTKRTN